MSAVFALMMGFGIGGAAFDHEGWIFSAVFSCFGMAALWVSDEG